MKDKAKSKDELISEFEGHYSIGLVGWRIAPFYFYLLGYPTD
jgi:hypothetical protein